MAANSTRCRDGVKVLTVVSFRSSLVGFEAYIPISACFHEGKLFVTCYLDTVPSNMFCISFTDKKCIVSVYFIVLHLQYFLNSILKAILKIDLFESCFPD